MKHFWVGSIQKVCGGFTRLTLMLYIKPISCSWEENKFQKKKKKKLTFLRPRLSATEKCMQWASKKRGRTKRQMAFDSLEAQKLNSEIFETIYYNALKASSELADAHYNLLSEAIEDARYHKERTVLQPTSMPATAAGASNMNGYTIAPFPMAVGPILVPVQVQNSLKKKNFQLGDQVQNGATMLLHPFPVIPVATTEYIEPLRQLLGSLSHIS